MAKKKTIAKDTPLAEITLRRYERPYELSKRELIRKLCLSVGLLQPGDSRDVIVDVLQTLVTSENEISSEEIRDLVIQNRKNEKLPLNGIASSNIRRQLKRLRDLFLIEKIANNYRVTEKSAMHSIFMDKIEKYYLESIKDRVKEYFRAVDQEFAGVAEKK